MNNQEIQNSFIKQRSEFQKLLNSVRREVEESLKLKISDHSTTSVSHPQWIIVKDKKRITFRIYFDGTVLVYHSKIEHPIIDVEDSNKFISFKLMSDNGFNNLIKNIKDYLN